MHTDVIAQLGQLAGNLAVREKRAGLPIKGIGAGTRALLGAGLGAALGGGTAAATGGDVGAGTLGGMGIGAGLGAGSKGMAKMLPSGKSLGGVASSVGKTLATPFTRQAPGMPPGAREFAAGRTAAIVGAPLLAQGVAGHSLEKAQHEPGHWWKNPLGAAMGTTDEDAFRNSNEAFQNESAPLRAKIQEAIGKNDFATVDKLQKQLDSGNFQARSGWDPRSWRMGGLNPWASPGGKYYQQKALGVQNKLQGEYNTAMGNVGPQEGDFARIDQLRQRMKGDTPMLPGQADELQKQLGHLEKRVRMDPGVESPEAKAVADRMAAMGMRLTPRKHPLSGGSTGWGNNFNGLPPKHLFSEPGSNWGRFAQGDVPSYPIDYPSLRP